MGQRGGGSGINLRNVVILSTSQTFTVPPNVEKLYLWMCAGGSQGDWSGNSGTTYDRACGGMGAMPREYVVPVTPGQQFSVVIGAGGGAVGGATYFGAYSAAAPEVIFGEHDDILKVYGNAGSGYADRTLFMYTQGEAGNAGTLDDRGVSANRGYCWLNGEIYCGGGGAFFFDDSNGTHGTVTWTGNPTTVPAGGGPALPAISITERNSAPYWSFSIAGGITQASKYGAGGILYYVNGPDITGDFTNPAKLVGYQGVVIIGY
jgi:hypothetical protein